MEGQNEQNIHDDIPVSNDIIETPVNTVSIEASTSYAPAIPAPAIQAPAIQAPAIQAPAIQAPAIPAIAVGASSNLTILMDTINEFPDSQCFFSFITALLLRAVAYGCKLDYFDNLHPLVLYHAFVPLLCFYVVKLALSCPSELECLSKFEFLSEFEYPPVLGYLSSRIDVDNAFGICNIRPPSRYQGLGDRIFRSISFFSSLLIMAIISHAAEYYELWTLVPRCPYFDHVQMRWLFNKSWGWTVLAFGFSFRCTFWLFVTLFFGRTFEDYIEIQNTNTFGRFYLIFDGLAQSFRTTCSYYHDNLRVMVWMHFWCFLELWVMCVGFTPVMLLGYCVNYLLGP